MSSNRKVVLDWMLENEPDIITKIHQILKKYGITEDAYAQVFCLVFNETESQNDKVTYIANTNQWQVGTKIMSDAKLLVSLSKICELIHDYILYNWNESLFAHWISAKELKKIETAMDHMESLAKLQSILTIASESVSVEVSASSRINWDTDDDDE